MASAAIPPEGTACPEAGASEPLPGFPCQNDFTYRLISSCEPTLTRVSSPARAIVFQRDGRIE